jgi:hypothetical protein
MDTGGVMHRYVMLLGPTASGKSLLKGFNKETIGRELGPHDGITEHDTTPSHQVLGKTNWKNSEAYVSIKSSRDLSVCAVIIAPPLLVLRQQYRSRFKERASVKRLEMYSDHVFMRGHYSQIFQKVFDHPNVERPILAWTGFTFVEITIVSDLMRLLEC